MDPQAPPPWLMFGIMAGAVSAFCAIVVVGGGLLRTLRGESFWPGGEARRPSPARPGPRPRLRNAVTKARTTLQPRNEPFKASEKEVPPPLPVTSLRNDVPETEQVSTIEAALIAVKLSQQIAPSNIAKSLPGYTPGRYKEYSAKVQAVKAALAEAEGLAFQPLVEETSR